MPAGRAYSVAIIIDVKNDRALAQAMMPIGWTKDPATRPISPAPMYPSPAL